MTTIDESGFKVPPHCDEAEESVIGACFLDPEAYERIVGRVDHLDFYTERYAVIFNYIQTLHAEGRPVDIVTVADRLKEQGELRKVGGVSALAELVEGAVTAANVEHHADMIRDKAKQRTIIRVLSEAVDQCYECNEPPSVVLDRAESVLFEVSNEKDSAPFFKVDSLIPEALEKIDDIIANPSAVTGLACGFDSLDRMTGGFQPSDLIIVAGRPSMGKTALVLNMAENIAIPHEAGSNQSCPGVGIFSLEMSKEQLIQRMICSQAKIDMYEMRAGRTKKEDIVRITTASSRIAESSIFIDDTAGLTVSELRSKARRMVKQAPNGLGLIMVDYLQLMRGGGGEASREQEVSGISRGLKALAKELAIPVVALSQLNRNVELRESKRPVMADLRDSGTIEQDADVVVLIYRDEVYNPKTEKPGIAELIVGKHRNGQVGVASASWNAKFTRFENMSYENQV